MVVCVNLHKKSYYSYIVKERKEYLQVETEGLRGGWVAAINAGDQDRDTEAT